MNIHLKSDEEISREEVWFFYNSLMNYGFHRLVTAEQEVILSKGNTPLAIENKESASNLFQQKNTPKGATKTQLATYNALAKKYNEMSRDAMKISMKDVEQLKYIYSIMSDKQKADAEPFPDFPEPPPFPKTPKAPEQEVKNSNTGFLEVNGQTIFYVSKKGENAYYNRWGQKVNRKGEIISKEQAHAEKIIEGQVISKVYKDNKVVVEFNTDNVSIAPPLPPLPPEPIEPLDFIITMAKKGADFYYEGKKINSDKAIELFKKNKSLNINSSGINSKAPWVKITKKPIKIGSIQEKKIVDPVTGYFVSLDKQEPDVATQKSKTGISSGHESLIKNAQKKNITFYHKNKPKSISNARQLLLKYQENAAIVSHNKPDLKRLDIITDVDKSSKEFTSKQYEAISL